ncbi:MAG: hypothetical protein QGD94_02150 [Planctomycetia bacterium]|nr:hypothetical protein [Planctomycetia bacterium]
MEQDSKSERDSWHEHIEKRARALGLPCNPEAHQDGGMASAATAYTISEADVIASVLNSADIPAWVDAPRSAMMLWHMQAGTRAGGIRVLVPFGRLKDAQQVLAEKEASASEKIEPTKAEKLAHEARKLLIPGMALAFIFPPFALYAIVKIFVLRFALKKERLTDGDCRDLAKGRKYLFFAAIAHGPLMTLYSWYLYMMVFS